MSWAQQISQRPYEAYTEPRISPFGEDQLAAFDLARGLPGVGQAQYGTANDLTGAGAGVMANSGYQAGTINPMNVAADQVSTGTWNTAAAQQYMDPYLTQVMDTVLARGEDMFARDQNDRNSRAARSGAFGGLRQGVEDAVSNSEFRRNVSEREAALMSDAYRTGMSGFMQDQGRALQAGMSNQDANLRAGLANQSTGIEAARLNEMFRQEQARLGQAQAQGLGAFGEQFANLADRERSNYVDSIDMLRDVGLDQQRQTQASLDLAYEDFQNQRDYEMRMLDFYNNIIRGNVTGMNQSVSGYQYSSPYSQALGLGLGAAGLYQALQGGGGGGG